MPIGLVMSFQQLYYAKQGMKFVPKGEGSGDLDEFLRNEDLENGLKSS